METTLLRSHYPDQADDSIPPTPSPDASININLV